MGILKLFGIGKSKTPAAGNIINSEATKCPYCSITLSKAPGRKTKCKSCGNFMMVRTDPTTNQRVVVTEEGAKHIEIEWMKVNGTYEDYLKEQKQFEDEKSDLAKKLGGTPSDGDVKWSIANKKSLKALKKGDIHEYMQIKHGMACQCYEEKSYKNAIPLFMESFYLTVNLLYLHDHTLDQKMFANLRKNEEFKPITIAGGFMAMFKEIIRAENKNIDDLKTVFLKSVEHLSHFPRLPFKAEKVWEIVVNDVRKAA